MPQPPGTRFRIRKTKKGYQRIAFDKSGNVLEVAKMKRNKKGKLKRSGKLKKIAHKKKCLGKK